MYRVWCKIDLQICNILLTLKHINFVRIQQNVRKKEFDSLQYWWSQFLPPKPLFKNIIFWYQFLKRRTMFNNTNGAIIFERWLHHNFLDLFAKKTGFYALNREELASVFSISAILCLEYHTWLINFDGMPCTKWNLASVGSIRRT